MSKFGDKPSKLPEGLEALLTSKLTLDEKGEAQVESHTKEQEEKAKELLDEVQEVDGKSSRERVEKTNKDFLSALMGRLVSQPQKETEELDKIEQENVNDKETGIDELEM